MRRRVTPTAHRRPARLTRYRGGTYSATVDTVTFVDGSTARTDLIRLTRVSTRTRWTSRGVADTSVALPDGHLVGGAEPAGARVRGRGRLDPAQLVPAADRSQELSRRLRAAGYPLGAANISEHGAIAGTQAAIWRFTNSTGPRQPSVERARLGGNGPEESRSSSTENACWAGEVDLIAAGSVVEVELHRSDDGSVWQPVDRSRLTLAAGTRTHHKGWASGRRSPVPPGAAVMSAIGTTA